MGCGSVSLLCVLLFSKNNLPGMVPIANSNVSFGNAKEMSRNDIARLNTLYKCCEFHMSTLWINIHIHILVNTNCLSAVCVYYSNHILPNPPLHCCYRKRLSRWEVQGKMSPHVHWRTDAADHNSQSQYDKITLSESQHSLSILSSHLCNQGILIQSFIFSWVAVCSSCVMSSVTMTLQCH